MLTKYISIFIFSALRALGGDVEIFKTKFCVGSRNKFLGRSWWKDRSAKGNFTCALVFQTKFLRGDLDKKIDFQRIEISNSSPILFYLLGSNSSSKDWRIFLPRDEFAKNSSKFAKISNKSYKTVFQNGNVCDFQLLGNIEYQYYLHILQTLRWQSRSKFAIGEV